MVYPIKRVRRIIYTFLFLKTVLELHNNWIKKKCTVNQIFFIHLQTDKILTITTSDVVMINMNNTEFQFPY